MVEAGPCERRGVAGPSRSDFKAASPEGEHDEHERNAAIIVLAPDAQHARSGERPPRCVPRKDRVGTAIADRRRLRALRLSR